MSQWPKWLRHQYGKLEICGSSSGYDTNFSLKIMKTKLVTSCHKGARGRAFDMEEVTGVERVVAARDTLCELDKELSGW